MNKHQAQQIIRDTFESAFNKNGFTGFIKNLLNKIEYAPFTYQGKYIPDAYKQYIKTLERIGKYNDGENSIDILVITLQKETSLERARTMQRNFIAWYLNGSQGGELKDAALVAFVAPNEDDWRFSLVKMDYRFEQVENGKVKVKEEFSPVKRFSYLLGEDEKSYTAQKQFLKFFIEKDDEQKITLKDLQTIFSLEVVTKEFFDGFLKIFNQLWKHILNQLKNKEDNYLEKSKEATLQILNRLLFIYFIQRKSEWFDYIPDNKRLIDFLVEQYKASKQLADSFYSNWLNVLFLETFNNKKTLLNTNSRNYFPTPIRDVLFKMPYLNGGLFAENENDELEFNVSDKLAIDEIINFLNTFNFTIIESMPLDKEVAINPEVIGTIYEKFVNLETTPELKEKYQSEGSSKGIIYTQEDEINFMCRKVLVHYLQNNTDLALETIYNFIFSSDEFSDDNEFVISDTGQFEQLQQAIANVKIVDPACGSGSFLVGMVNLLHELHKKLIKFNPAENPKDYAIRKAIIENNVFGVDVMEWAVKIAELRLWLFLIVESDLKWTELQFTPLLPNLSFKIRQGDSLIEEVGDVDLSAIRESRFISPSLKRKITELKKEKIHFTKNEKGHKPKWQIEKIELDIYRGIIYEKIQNIKKEKNNLRRQEKPDIPLLFAEMKKDKVEQKDLFEKQKQEKLQALEKELAHWENIRNAFGKDVKPFVWDIDFAEIFFDEAQNGFDVVIGNPPYVRQEKIAPPLRSENEFTANQWRETKKAYKDKLQNMVANLYGKQFKPDGKADLYVYFYFKALSLLNPNGAFTFITSNSWLDVGFGKALQEFFLKRVKIYSINDNQARRSFKEADVNTIIIFTSAPTAFVMASGRSPLRHIAKFVMFNKPFAQTVTKNNLLFIDRSEVKIVDKDLTELVDNVVKHDDFRIFPVKQNDLFNDGAKEDGSLKVYEGNKWGGKFLRAPDIFFTILKKGKDYIGSFREYLDGERYLNTGGADGFFVVTKFKDDGDYYQVNNNRTIDKHAEFSGKIERTYLKPLIKDITKKNKSIEITEADALCLVVEKSPSNFVKPYIKWGESNDYHKRSVTRSQKPWYKPTRQMLHAAEILLPRSFNDTFVIHYNPSKYLSLRFYRMHIKKGETSQIVAYLNSSLFWLIFETLGNKNLGQGALDFYMASFLAMKIPIILNEELEKPFLYLCKREIKPIFTELGFDRFSSIREQEPNPLPDRKALDDIVFDALGLTEDERKEIYWAVAELVKNRLDKARNL